MTLFCFLNLRPSEHGGLAPDCPPEASFGLLADLRDLGWGLYSVDIEDPSEGWPGARPVDDELDALIRSGIRYPPALALARDDVTRVFGERRPTEEEFAAAYADYIRERLSQQANSRYHLLRCVRDELGYMTEGGWYWVLSVSGAPLMASWVSADYFVYKSPAEHFALDQAHAGA